MIPTVTPRPADKLVVIQLEPGKTAALTVEAALTVAMQLTAAAYAADPDTARAVSDGQRIPVRSNQR